MSVRHALLALLSCGSQITYQLRKEFEEATGQTWPLNIGQVSTTLERLARDGLVVRADAVEDAHTREPWSLTDAGRAELAAWWRSPVGRAVPDRDELVIKLALAVTLPDVDVAAVVQAQRSASLRVLHDLTRLQNGLDGDEIAAALVLDHHVFATEAELRWLDDVEGVLARVPRRRRLVPDDGPSEGHDPHDARAQQEAER